eukprot:COSAG01_NODE_8431_length_2786_cov_4.016003_3_plen_219_part_00
MILEQAAQHRRITAPHSEMRPYSNRHHRTAGRDVWRNLFLRYSSRTYVRSVHMHPSFSPRGADWVATPASSLLAPTALFNFLTTFLACAGLERGPGAAVPKTMHGMAAPSRRPSSAHAASHREHGSTGRAHSFQQHEGPAGRPSSAPAARRGRRGSSRSSRNAVAADSDVNLVVATRSGGGSKPAFMQGTELVRHRQRRTTAPHCGQAVPKICCAGAC